MLTTCSWNVIDKSLISVNGNNNEFVAAMMTKDYIVIVRKSRPGDSRT